ncbi:alpha/beta hydrolase [Maricurvus nonylphenolicus]
MPQIHSNGINIEYETFGNQQDPYLLLIAGVGQQLTMWPQAFCQLLAEKGFFVIRFDNRDVGLSTKYSESKEPGLLRLFLHQLWGGPISPVYSLDDMTKDCVGLLDALGIEKAHIIGASMGGMIAQLIAANFPGKTLSLTSIMSTSGSPSLPKPAPYVVRNTFIKSIVNTKTFIINKAKYIQHNSECLRILGSKSFPLDETTRQEIVAKDMARSFYPQGFKRQMTAIIVDGDRSLRLAKIQAPTLVIHGEQDPLFAVECGRHTAESIPNAELACIKDMAHDLPPELYEKITGLITTHISQHLCPGSNSLKENEHSYADHHA